VAVAKDVHNCIDNHPTVVTPHSIPDLSYEITEVKPDYW
jgi:hypothetical protein